MVKQDIGALNRNIAQLQTFARKDASILSNRSAQTYAKNVVLSLQSRLAHMSRRFKQVLEVSAKSCSGDNHTDNPDSNQEHERSTRPPQSVRLRCRCHLCRWR